MSNTLSKLQIIIMILSYCSLNEFVFAQGNQPGQNPGLSNTNANSSAINDPKSAKPEDYYTAFWYARCNGELVEIAKGKLKKTAVSMTLQRVIKKVDIAAFNKAINYKSQACGKLAKPAEEFFFIQLDNDGKIDKVNNGENSNSSMVPTCWNVRNLNDYLNTCGKAGAASSNTLGSCKSINLCNCDVLKKTYACQPNACPSMYVVCH